MRFCWACHGHGKRNKDEPNCYRPGDLCKWIDGVCEEVGEGEPCLCDSIIVLCTNCDGRGEVPSPLEQLAEASE